MKSAKRGHRGEREQTLLTREAWDQWVSSMANQALIGHNVFRPNNLVFILGAEGKGTLRRCCVVLATRYEQYSSLFPLALPEQVATLTRPLDKNVLLELRVPVLPFIHCFSIHVPVEVRVTDESILSTLAALTQQYRC